jgi:hypothetical protein
VKELKEGKSRMKLLQSLNERSFVLASKRGLKDLSEKEKADLIE